MVHGSDITRGRGTRLRLRTVRPSPLHLASVGEVGQSAESEVTALGGARRTPPLISPDAKHTAAGTSHLRRRRVVTRRRRRAPWEVAM